MTVHMLLKRKGDKSTPRLYSMKEKGERSDPNSLG
jgi:hypothetical protein